MDAPNRLDRISAEARQLQFGRAILTIVFTPLFLVGWLLGKSWRAVTYALAALKVGWHEGNGT
jgi:hypothetical protein